jgi:hypothetical protein
VSSNPNVAHTDEPASLYHSYLVRLWRSNTQNDWRASAQCVQSGRTVAFGDLESLYAFLQHEIRGGSSPDGAEVSQ